MFGYSSTINWEQFTDKEKVILESLPHGSGIDYDWHIEKQKNGKIKAFNAYHGMNDWGMYVRSVDFSVTFHSDNPGEFKLVFHADSGDRYWIDKWGLREYLEDTLFYCALHS
jgi:hypothetical protein